MDSQDFLEGLDLFYGIGEIDGDDECRSFHLRDAHEKFPAVTAGMKSSRIDTAFGVRFILSFTSYHKCHNFPRREKVFLLAQLGNDFLFGTGIAFILAQLPIGPSVDSLRGPSK